MVRSIKVGVFPVKGVSIIAVSEAREPCAGRMLLYIYDFFFFFNIISFFKTLIEKRTKKKRKKEKKNGKKRRKKKKPIINTC